MWNRKTILLKMDITQGLVDTNLTNFPPKKSKGYLGQRNQADGLKTDPWANKLSGRILYTVAKRISVISKPPKTQVINNGKIQ